MRVAQGHLHGTVAQQITDGVQRDTRLNQPRGKVMAHIVPAEFINPGAQKNVSPGLPKSGGDVKDLPGIPGLFAPAPQHAYRFVIQRHMTSLSILCIPSFNGEQPTIEATQTHRILSTSPRRSPVFMESRTAGVR
jgi:hypothetical protein